MAHVMCHIFHFPLDWSPQTLFIKSLAQLLQNWTNTKKTNANSKPWVFEEEVKESWLGFWPGTTWLVDLVCVWVVWRWGVRNAIRCGYWCSFVWRWNIKSRLVSRDMFPAPFLLDSISYPFIHQNNIRLANIFLRKSMHLERKQKLCYFLHPPTFESHFQYSFNNSLKQVEYFEEKKVVN